MAVTHESSFPEDVKKLVEPAISDSRSFRDSTPLTLRGLRHLVLSLDRIDGRNHFVDGCVPLDSSEPLLAVQQHCGEPTLAHFAVTVAFDVTLATPNHGEHALDGIRRVQALAQ